MINKKPLGFTKDKPFKEIIVRTQGAYYEIIIDGKVQNDIRSLVLDIGVDRVPTLTTKRNFINYDYFNDKKENNE